VLDPAPEPPSQPPADAPPDAPVRVPRRTTLLDRLGALTEVLVCSGFPTQSFVFGILTALGVSSRGADGVWSPHFVVTLSLIDMVVVLGLVWFFLWTHGETVRGFVVGPRRPAREAVLGLLLVPAAFILVVIVLAVTISLQPALHNVPVNPFGRMMTTPRDTAIFAFVVMFAGGVREEVQRAFILRRFDQYLGGAAIGILVFSVVFGLGHLDQGYAAAIATGVLGAAWGIVYWLRRSIIAPIVCHAGFNLTQLLKYVAFVSR
jgi:membrane protease YdiL (CAAX protease family)